MAASSRRAVVTGVGALSAIGNDAASFWASLLARRSGIRAIEGFDTSGLSTRFAGQIRDFDAKKYLDKKDRKALRVMARTVQLGVAAAQLALDHGKVDKTKLDPTRFGIEFGSGLIATELEELGDASLLSVNGRAGQVNLEKWGDQGLANIAPLWMLKYLPNMPACHVSILHNAQGPNNTITENDVAGLLAMGEAYRILLRDQADFFLVGGAESRLNPLSLVRQCLFQPLSRRNDAPERAARPFDKNRDGVVLGEGACVLVLEERTHALRRGARIYAEVVGFGAAFDRGRTGAGLARAIRAALKEAGIGPAEVDHVNAHGIGSIESDAWEARGIREAFAERVTAVPVFAPKSYFGHLGAGGALTELAASLLGMQHGVVPATLNYEEPDPACPVTVIAGSPRRVETPFVLKISLTPMGQCAALVCRNENEGRPAELP
jgi:3-oxoacyl-[acyl-carrier-protein] synthase II